MNRHPRAITVGAAALLLLGGCGSAAAHELSRSLSRLEVDGRDVRATLTLDLLQFPGVDRDGDRRVTYDELDETLDRVYDLVKRHYQVIADGVPPERITLERADIVQDDHIVELELSHRFAGVVDRLTVRCTIFEIAGPDHRHLLGARLGDDVQQALLDAGRPSVDLSLQPASRVQTLWSFLRLGIEHIFTGYDHLAFLVCLLVGTSGLRSLMGVVTSFTVAHSLTLALATFDLVVIPTRLTETLIALSIAYVALENLFDVRAVERYRVTFLFGLVHGFGFSNVLREMHLPPGGLALSLFSFNAGVEIGQVVFVVVMFPVLAGLGRWGWPRLRPAVSMGVAGLAAYWFVQRAFWG